MYFCRKTKCMGYLKLFFTGVFVLILLSADAIHASNNSVISQTISETQYVTIDVYQKLPPHRAPGMNPYEKIKSLNGIVVINFKDNFSHVKIQILKDDGFIVSDKIYSFISSNTSILKDLTVSGEGKYTILILVDEKVHTMKELIFEKRY